MARIGTICSHPRLWAISCSLAANHLASGIPGHGAGRGSANPECRLNGGSRAIRFRFGGEGPTIRGSTHFGESREHALF